MTSISQSEAQTGTSTGSRPRVLTQTHHTACQPSVSQEIRVQLKKKKKKKSSTQLSPFHSNKICFLAEESPLKQVVNESAKEVSGYHPEQDSPKQPLEGTGSVGHPVNWPPCSPTELSLGLSLHNLPPTFLGHGSGLSNQQDSSGGLSSCSAQPLPVARQPAPCFSSMMMDTTCQGSWEYF